MAVWSHFPMFLLFAFSPLYLKGQVKSDMLREVTAYTGKGHQFENEPTPLQPLNMESTLYQAVSCWGAPCFIFLCSAPQKYSCNKKNIKYNNRE